MREIRGPTRAPFHSYPPKLWQVWWLYGIPLSLVAAAMFAVAENARDAGQAYWGDLLDIAMALP
jgi:hypothetical protein